MQTKVITAMIIALFTAGMLSMAFNIDSVKAYENLLINGDFSAGLYGWMVCVEYYHDYQTHTGPEWELIVDKGYGWTDIAVIDEDARKNVLDIQQEIDDGDGDWTGAYQILDLDVSNYGELYFEADGKAIYQSLEDDGWSDGEYPVSFGIRYTDINGVYHSGIKDPDGLWQHGFYYLGTGEYPWSEKVAQNTWFHYKSPNLMSLSAKPKIIHQVCLYSSGWAYHGRMDNAKLYGKLAAVGGVWVPVDKFGLLAPYIGLASTILVATVAAAIYVKRVKQRKKKQ